MNGRFPTHKTMSLPPRERGLKLLRVTHITRISLVAPSTGAWIETNLLILVLMVAQVAPSTGAWIETITQSLKTPTKQVAPSTGAWIETTPVI